MSDVLEPQPSDLPEVHVRTGDTKPVVWRVREMNDVKLEVSDEAMDQMKLADESAESDWLLGACILAEGTFEWVSTIEG